MGICHDADKRGQYVVPNGALEADDGVPSDQQVQLIRRELAHSDQYDSSNLSAKGGLYRILYGKCYLYSTSTHYNWIFSNRILQKYEINDGDKRFVFNFVGGLLLDVLRDS